MLKKLFLPLYIIAIVGITLTSINPSSALTNPCAGAEASKQSSAIESCHNGNNYQQYLKDLQAEQDTKAACCRSKTGGNAEAYSNCMNTGGGNSCSGTDTPGGGGGGGGSGEGNKWKEENDANPTGTEEQYTNPVNQYKSNDYREGYDLPNDPQANLTVESGCRGFLGMVSWDCNTNFEDADSQDDVPRIVVMIAANIFTDITVIASYLVIAYIIYGGYLYIFANGEVSKITTGKKALNQAFIGLAITLSANIIVNAIRIALMHNSGSFTSCASSECVSADSLVSNLIQWVIGIGGAVAAVFVIGGGIMYMTSAGDPNKLQTAKNIIKYALIGLIIVALSEVVTIFMTNVIVNAKKDANVTNDISYIINIKEFYENQKMS